MQIPEIGCLSVGNEERTRRMKERFDLLHIKHKLFTSFTYPSHFESLLNERIYNCMINHLLIIQHYYDLGCPFIIVCENDVYIDKHLQEGITYVMNQMQRFNYDIILLGCLLSSIPTHPGIFSYNDDQWGTQAYILTHSYASRLLERWNHWTPEDKEGTFAADWTITKSTSNRGLIYPLLFVEEGESGNNHDIHHQFHSYCTSLHYNAAYYI